MKLFSLAASHRRESINRKLVRVASDCSLALGAEVEIADYGDFDAPLYDDEMFDGSLPIPVQRFCDVLYKADGIILASPEYNWSFPGSLKNLIDWASVAKPNPFMTKGVLLISASPSLRGGAQGLVQLQPPLAALGAFVYPRLYTLSRANSLFDENGLTDKRLHSELKDLVSGFMEYLKSLKGIRTANYCGG